MSENRPVAIKEKRRQYVKDHVLELHFFRRPTFCYHCNQFIYGLGKQGFQCLQCGLATHKYCAPLIVYNCTRNADVIQSECTEGFAHHFKKHQFLKPSICDHCGQFIFALRSQGYHCEDEICQMNVHSHCLRFVANNCGFHRHKKYGNMMLKLNCEVNDNAVNLNISVTQCQNLLPADSNGLSDPYVNIQVKSLNGEIIAKFQTKIQFKTLNPQFNESFECSFPFSPDTWIYLQVFDYDNPLQSDFLGGFCLNISDAMTYSIGNPVWFHLLSETLCKTTHKVLLLEEDHAVRKLVDETNNMYESLKSEFSFKQSLLRKPEPEKPKIMSLNDFLLRDILGKGGFGKVFLARANVVNGEQFAIKVMPKFKLIEVDAIECVNVEKNIMSGKNTDHNFITRMYASFQDEYNVYLVMEYLSGFDLMHHLNDEICFDEERTRFYIAELSLPLFFLHKRGIIYRDLKPENILLDSDGHIKLTDFGLSREGIIQDQTKADSFCGTLPYMAPEMLDRKSYDTSVDLWSLGVMTFEMLTGFLPFFGISESHLYIKIHQKLTYPSCLSIPVITFITHLLKINPTYRLGYDVTNGEAYFREHVFFDSIDWNQLELRRVSPPFVPLNPAVNNPNNSINSSNATNIKVSFTDPPNSLIIDHNLFSDFDYTTDNMEVINQTMNFTVI